ncbi:DPP IV N-terminal domain-containing protein [Pelagibacterium sp.]|uniref:S9 family peptidase n=1 Tax=Pelagibacterium sp. TaxID=1967288 RepID=UPI003A93719C
MAGNGFAGIVSFKWSSDGKSIVLVEADDTNTRKIEIAYDARGEARKDRFTRAFPGDLLTRRRIGCIALSGGGPAWFDRPDAEDAVWGYGLSPDGSTLFISSSDLSIKTHTIFMFDTRSGARTVQYTAHDPLKIRPDWQVEFAPDGQSLIVMTDRDGFNHLHRLAAASAALEPLTSGAWEIAEFAVDPANGTVYFVSNAAHPAERHVYCVPPAGGEVRRLTHAAGIHVPVYAPDFQALADLFSDDMTPPELFVQPLPDSAEATRITHSPRPEFSQRDWAHVRYVPFVSHVDGAELTARVMLPPGFKLNGSYPMVVGSIYSDGLLNQWGGRAAHPSWGIDQYLASRGFVVVSPEIRGSFGRGRDWNRPMLNSYGSQDIEDIADCVTTLVDLGYAHRKRVGLWGSSYGGLMTLMSLFKKPGFYAAGFAGAPATNVWHAYPEQGWIMGLAKGEDFIDRYSA